MRTVVLASVLVCGCASSSAVAPSVAPPSAVPATTTAPIADPKAIAAMSEGERTLAAVGSDCAGACQALRRIMTARIQLCSPRTSACDDAERREDEARKHVASFCECPP